MGAKATGNVEWRKGRAYARVTLPEKGPNGKERRRRVTLPRGLSPIEAKKQAAEISELVRTGVFVFEGTTRSKKPLLVKGEPTDTWFDRFCFYREQRGHTTVPDDKSRYKTHIQTVIGAKPFGQTTRRDVEKIRDALDAKVQADMLGWKTAWNVWGLLKRMCRDAQRSKHADLRLVGFEDPSHDVEGPDRGAKKTKAYLFPSEFLALVNCTAVPLVRRRMYAVAVYTYARAGELEALEWPDVNLEHDTIGISRAIERKTGKVGTPKSEDARDIPVETELKPLLAFLAKQDAGARVLRMPPDEDRADLLRADLGRAGVDRAALFVERKDTNRKRMTFHDLKATGITWAAVRGDDPVKIHRRAAHRDFKTTLGYIREAENLKAGFGTPFPALPACLLAGEESATSESAPPSNSGDLPPVDVGVLAIESAKNLAESASSHVFNSRWGRNSSEELDTKGADSGGRLRLIEALSAAVRDGALERDAHLLRIATEALTKLTVIGDGEQAPVVDLATERARRDDGGGR